MLGVDWKVDAIVDPSVHAHERRPLPPAPPWRARCPPGGRPPRPRWLPRRRPRTSPAADEAPSADDEDADDGALTHEDLLARELGAKVIGEYDAS